MSVFCLKATAHLETRTALVQMPFAIYVKLYRYHFSAALYSMLLMSLNLIAMVPVHLSNNSF